MVDAVDVVFRPSQVTAPPRQLEGVGRSKYRIPFIIIA